jgi:hypothetical protein
VDLAALETIGTEMSCDAMVGEMRRKVWNRLKMELKATPMWGP